MSLPIHIGQMERVGAGQVVVTEICQDYNYAARELTGTITLQFFGDIFTEASPASNYLGIPLPSPPSLVNQPTPTTPPPASLGALFKPFQRRISA